MSGEREQREPPPVARDARRDALIAGMRRRIVVLEEPDVRGFNDGLHPLHPSLDIAACLGRGIPPRPSDPAALTLWLRMVAQPLNVTPLSAGQVAQLTLRGDIGHRFTLSAGASGDALDEGQEQAGAVLSGGGRLSSSANWSGAAIVPRDGERFSQVLASWTVPAVSPGEGDGPWVCSTWIGLDGLRRWMGSMPQMGTTQSFGDIDSHNYPSNFAWFQWWLRGRGVQEPVPFKDVPIEPGDTIYCAVTRLPRDQPTPGAEHCVQFFLKVEGLKGKAIAIPLIVKEPPTDGPDDKIASRGASAQWILERPTALEKSPNGLVRKGDLFPLPDFGTAGTTAFAAAMALTPDAFGVTDALNEPAPAFTPARRLRTPRLLRMARREDDPPRISVIAKPSMTPDGVITVRYRGR